MSSATTTSYALLGLLALRPWTAYELVGQTQRSMRFFWPRSEAHVYSEVKRLRGLGWAAATKEHTGRRSRTRYEITDEGRTALAAWLRSPPAPPLLEMEGVLRLFLADQGSVEDLRRSLALLQEQARELDDSGRALTREIAETGGPFPERTHLVLPLAELYHAILAVISDWAERTAADVAQWEATTGRPATAAEQDRLRSIADDGQAAPGVSR